MATNPKSKPPSGKGRYSLEVPLDASQVENFDSQRSLKAVARNRQGNIQSASVSFRNKTGTANFQFEENPGRLTVAIGPADAPDEDLFRLQTLQVEIPASRWVDATVVKLPPIIIPTPIWWWWWRW